MQALLSIGDLNHVLFLLNNLPRWSCTSYREINTLLTKIIAYIIDPLYKGYEEGRKESFLKNNLVFFPSVVMRMFILVFFNMNYPIH